MLSPKEILGFYPLPLSPGIDLPNSKPKKTQCIYSHTLNLLPSPHTLHLLLIPQDATKTNEHQTSSYGPTPPPPKKLSNWTPQSPFSHLLTKSTCFFWLQYNFSIRIFNRGTMKIFVYFSKIVHVGLLVDCRELSNNTFMLEI